MKTKSNYLFSVINCVVRCTTQTSNNTDDMLETKTYLYSYDYETEPDGELNVQLITKRSHPLIRMNPEML